MQPNARRRKLIPKRIETRSSQELWLDAFLDYIAGEKQLAENTVAAYRRDMVRFFQWLGGRQIQRMSVQQLSDYVDWLHRQHLAPASLGRHIVSLRLFLRFLQLEGALKENAAELLGSQKLWERMPLVLTAGQVDDLLVAPQPDEDKLWLRDRAILEFFYATGCRVSELANLRLRDVHLAEGFCQCTGKGNKQRMVPIGRQAITAFQRWLEEERPKVACRGLHESRDFFVAEEKPQKKSVSKSINNESPLTSALDWAFLSYKGRQIRRQAMWELIKKYAVRVGAPMEISPHTMRHSFATHMLQGGADIRQVQEMLGHASIVTTQIYTQVDMTRLKALHSKCHPRG